MNNKYLNTKKYICCVCGTARSSILLKIKGTTEMKTSLRKIKNTDNGIHTMNLKGIIVNR
jgi:hypothetical protein